MKRLLRVLCTVLLGMYALTTNAQQDVLFSHEYFSRVNKNPASTGNTDDIDVFLYGKLQWLGIENSPKTTVLDITNYVDKIRSGLGATLMLDAAGVGRRSTNAKLVYNYQFNINNSNILSLGLAGGLNMSSVDYTEHKIEDDSERADGYPSEKQREISPDVNIGLEWNNPHFSFGISMNHVMNGDSSEFKPRRSFYMYGSILCQMNQNLDFIPTLSYMHQYQYNVGDLGFMFFLHRTYWAGLSWRPDLHDKMHQSMMILSVGFSVSKFRFGYSYDLGFGSDYQLPSNSHEFMVSYGIGKNK